jgi:predicted O-methyltransferase YrrM
MTQKTLRAALARSIAAKDLRPGTNMGQSYRPTQVTAAETQFALAELVRVLAPADVLEIGTFFADTARVIAAAMAEIGMGHLITIDPFGGDRVPDIIEAWPVQLRERVEFRADNSMSFFLYLDEELHAKRGNNAPFEVIFIDGHHSFDYAFFDLMRSSLYVRPGGALVLDNIEQPGPATAIRLFLERHSHWQLFKADDVGGGDENPSFHAAANSAIILAPDGIEIGALPFRVDLYELPIAVLRTVRIRLLRCTPGTLRVFVNFYSRPVDRDTTGKGEQNRVGTAEWMVSGEDDHVVTITYDPPLALSPGSNDAVAAQVELSFAPASRGNLLVDIDSIMLE